MGLHIVFLHSSGSSNPLGVGSGMYKIYFSPFFLYKDLFAIFLFLVGFACLNFYSPLVLGDNENFIPANNIVTPAHIQPEWYFLFAYAILRSVPNKLGGVLALALSVIILYSLPFSHLAKVKVRRYSPSDKFIF